MDYNVIYTLTELVMKYSYQRKVFDKNFICEAYNVIINCNKELQSGIDGTPDFSNSFIKVKDDKLITTGASYNPLTGKLTFSCDGMSFNLNGELKLDSDTRLEELEYYIYMNLGAIRDILHELEHVRQTNIMLNENSDLSKLISNVQAKKGTFTIDFFNFLMSMGYKPKQIFSLSKQLVLNYQFNHDLFPTERAADTKSRSDIYRLAEDISNRAHIENLLVYLHKKMCDTTYSCYSFKNGKAVQTPIDLFASIHTLLSDMYEKYSGQIITGSMLKAPSTDEKDIILYGANVDEKQLNRFTK